MDSDSGWRVEPKLGNEHGDPSDERWLPVRLFDLQRNPGVHRLTHVGGKTADGGTCNRIVLEKGRGRGLHHFSSNNDTTSSAPQPLRASSMPVMPTGRLPGVIAVLIEFLTPPIGRLRDGSVAQKHPSGHDAVQKNSLRLCNPPS